MREQRTFDRTPCQIEVQTLDGHLTGRATNLSLGGLYFQCADLNVPKPGESLTLRLNLPDGPLIVKGLVEHQRSEVFFESLAVGFIEMGSETQNRLNAFLDRHKAQENGARQLGRLRLNRVHVAES